MYQKLCLASVLVSFTLLLAADPPWMSKRIPEWTEKDAYLVLSESPWVTKTPEFLTALLTASERREGGNMAAQDGAHKGIGMANAGSLISTGGAIARPGQGAEAPHLPRLTIRWESALPVRAAAIRANDTSAPEIDGEDYTIAVYAVSLKLAAMDLKGLNEELKKVATLTVEGRKEFRPTRVETVQLGDGMINVIYFFPRSAHITVEDPRVTFSGQVGRIVFAQYFYPARMQFMGRLEL
jgi:hypothetical protein